MNAVLSVTTWNVLANASLVQNWYPESDLSELTPGRRSHVIASLIESLPGDIIALQEVDPIIKQTLSHTHPREMVHWCPKGEGFPEGLLTIVRPSAWSIANEYRFAYRVASRLGQVAHILDLEHKDGASVRLINTHLRWQPLGTPASDRIGLLHAKELLHQWVEETDAAILAADLNDPPEGMVRQVLAQAGFQGLDKSWPTAFHGGTKPESIDVIAVTGCATIDHMVQPIDAQPPLPTLAFPSDHIPVNASITVPCDGRHLYDLPSLPISPV